MIWAFLIATAIALVAIFIAIQLGKRAHAQTKMVAQLGAELAKRDHVIKQMEAVYAEANARKDTLASGTDSERFDASLNVLHDISGKPPAARSPVADISRPGGAGKPVG
jgi:hypothetical protein